MSGEDESSGSSILTRPPRNDKILELTVILSNPTCKMLNRPEGI